jgi:hypothetical protein
MQITDQLDTDGNPIGLRGPIDVVQVGNTLRDKETGMCWAIKDCYGDWVNPTMHRIGVKSKMIVDESNGDSHRE